MSPVIAMLLCPNRSTTALICTPAAEAGFEAADAQAAAAWCHTGCFPDVGAHHVPLGAGDGDGQCFGAAVEAVGVGHGAGQIGPERRSSDRNRRRDCQSPGVVPVTTIG
jgi:hypothetical protein